LLTFLDDFLARATPCSEHCTYYMNLGLEKLHISFALIKKEVCSFFSP